MGGATATGFLSTWAWRPLPRSSCREDGADVQIRVYIWIYIRGFTPSSGLFRGLGFLEPELPHLHALWAVRTRADSRDSAQTVCILVVLTSSVLDFVIKAVQLVVPPRHEVITFLIALEPCQ